ncbi:hypothetical protein ACLM5H_24625 [Fredinandcohnia humi]
MKELKVLTMKNGTKLIELDSIETKYGRKRGILFNDVVALECTTCKGGFLLGSFHKQKQLKIGVKNACKTCRVEENKKSNSSLMKKASHQNWRAKQAGRVADLTTQDVERLYELATKKVVCCSITGKPLQRPVLGHLKPVEEAGSTLTNLIVISQKVNKLQASKDIFQWLLTEKAQEVVDIETVRETVEKLADLREVTPEELLKEHLSKKQIKEFMKIYN